jgi:hypothetical protein
MMSATKAELGGPSFSSIGRRRKIPPAAVRAAAV